MQEDKNDALRTELNRMRDFNVALLATLIATNAVSEDHLRLVMRKYAGSLFDREESEKLTELFMQLLEDASEWLAGQDLPDNFPQQMNAPE